MQWNGWIVYRQADALKNSAYINWFIDEAAKQGMSLQLIYRESLTIGIIRGRRTILYQHTPTSLPDFVVIRTIDYLLSVHLETAGINVFNSSAIASICNDKALTHHYLLELGIPMADTIYLEQESIPDNPPLPFPFVLKETASRGGEHVFRIENQSEWSTRIATVHSKHIVLQTCNVVLGKDVRVFIVGKNIVGAVLRENNHDFRANYKLGGTATWYVLCQEERAMINRIIKQFDFDMVGIDFLIDPNGKLLFNEIEDVVGSRTLSAVSDINILNLYCRHIKRKLTV